MDLIHERIARYGKEKPARLAARDEEGSLSYGELYARSSALADRLSALGLFLGDAVAVYVPYKKDIVLGAVAAWQAGGIFMPMDDAYPVDRLEYMLENSGARAILTCRSLWEEKKLAYPEDRVIFLDEPTATGEVFACPYELSQASPGMLLYTSGTTGRPKGVLHTHDILAHFTDWIQGDIALQEDARTAILTRFTFVGTVMFLFGTLYHGGTAYFAPPGARMDVEYLYQFLRQEGITHAFIPSGLAAIMAEDYDITGLHVFAAGEKLRNFKAHSPGNCLWNSYGATEIGGVFLAPIHGHEDPIPMGRPAGPTRALLVDEKLEPVAVGEAGELLIDNDYMSKAYFRLSELTAEKWVQKDGRVWYRTGDRARCTPEGVFYFLGRTDHMVKLRGFRIETGEVEAQVAKALQELHRDDVRDIVVTVKTIRNADRLVCYYEAGQDLDMAAVREKIAKSLADYMLPEFWVRVMAMPRNVNGKIMRQELPLPKRQTHREGALYSEVLARVVWTAEEVVGGSEAAGPADNFTDIGGNSLLAMKLSALLRDQGIKINSAQILQLGELEKIAAAAEVDYARLWSQEQYEAVVKDFAARGEHIERVLPLTNEQDERLFEQLIQPERNDCCSVHMIELDSLIREEDLRQALDQVAEENEELRAAVVFHHMPVIQQVITDRKIPLEMVNIENTDYQQLKSFRRQLLSLFVDPQRNSSLQVICAEGEGHSFLFILACCILFDKADLLRYYASILSLLEQKYPQDASIRAWREIFEEEKPQTQKQGGPAKGDVNKQKNSLSQLLHAKGQVPPALRIYAENTGPQMIFVHTANTGGEAYYRLAERIKNYMSFAVLEPFNLYHPQEASYGIKNIAARYIRTLKEYQPQGPYILGGWCYGGIIAHEMACQLEQAGEEIRQLFMLDSHAITDEKIRQMARTMFSLTDRDYFEKCPLFEELREGGLLEAIIQNYLHVARDTVEHEPSFFHGPVTYFKPEEVPAGQSEQALAYWKKMMEFDAGGYEHFCDREQLQIIHTPHEHDLMMDEASLDIIVPAIYGAIMGGKQNG